MKKLYLAQHVIYDYEESAVPFFASFDKEEAIAHAKSSPLPETGLVDHYNIVSEMDMDVESECVTIYCTSDNSGG